MKRLNKRYFWLSIPGAIFIVLLVSGCSSELPLNTLSSDSSPDAKRINDAFFVVLGIAIVVGVLVLGAIVYLVWRYRSKNKKGGDPYDPDNPDLSVLEEEDLPTQVHGNVRLEIAWTIIPAMILVFVAILTLVTLVEQNRITAADNQLKVDVVGQQWWWEFHYHIDGDRSTPPDFVSANELVMPVGQQVPLLVFARDVIHSFWIPKLNGKIDAVPGREHVWKLEASKPGTYKGQCTEFCGTSHGLMKMEVRALKPADWVLWAQNQMKNVAPLVEGEKGYSGQELFMANCARCHSISGLTDTNNDEIIDSWEIYSGGDPIHSQLISGAAPNLTHFASRTTYAGSIFDIYNKEIDIKDYLQVADTGELNRRDLRSWIQDAPNQKPAAPEESRGMPSFLNLNGEEIDSIIEFLATLK